MADEEKTLNLILKYGLDRASAEQTARGVSDTTKNLEAQERQLRKNRMELRELSQVFTAIGLLGASVYGPALLAANKYITAAGQTEIASSRWIASQKSIEESVIRVGRVVTTGLLPGFEQAAQIAEKFAAFAEKNPKAIQAAVGIAGGLVAIAAAGKIFTEVDRAIVDIQLIAANMMDKAADKQLAAAGGMEAGAATGGGGLTGILSSPAASAVVAALSLRPGKSGAQKFGEMLGSGQNPFAGSSSAAAPTGSLANSPQQAQLVQSYIDYQKQILAAEKQYGQQRADMVEQFEKQKTDMESSFQTSRVRQLRDNAQQEKQTEDDFYASALHDSVQLARDEQQTEQDYYKTRLKAATTYGTDELKAEQDHQLAMARLTEDHNDKVTDLVAARDALGLVREQRDYEKNRTRAEQDFQIAEAKRHKDFAVQIMDMETNFAEQRRQRLTAFTQQQIDNENAYNLAKQRRDAQFKQTQADAQADHDAQMKQLQANEVDTLSKLQTAYAEQVQTMKTAFVDRIRAIDQMVLGDYAAFQQHMAKMSQEFQNWLKNGSGQTSGASGGSSAPASGNTRFGFQESLIGSMVSSRSNAAASVSGGTSISQSFSGMTANDRAWVADMAGKIALNTVAGTMGA
jgi:hypothetical protein